ncbi:MAG: response regulator [Nanoarchaeota archaeon]|nr:response regulator [Nanoarchaeota archaeon]
MKKEDVRILVVDDDADIVETPLRELMGYSQIEVLWDGIGVVDRIREYNPHLVILDTQLPMGKSGFQVYDEIVEAGLREGMVVIGNSSGAYKDGWLNRGADDFLEKMEFVAHPDETDKQIQKALERRVTQEATA